MPFIPDIDLLDKTTDSAEDFNFNIAQIIADCEKETRIAAQGHTQQNVSVMTNAPPVNVHWLQNWHYQHHYQQMNCEHYIGHFAMLKRTVITMLF